MFPKVVCYNGSDIRSQLLVLHSQHRKGEWPPYRKDWKEQLQAQGSYLFHFYDLGEKEEQGLERKQGWGLDCEAIMESGKNCGIVGEKVLIMKERPEVTLQCD